MQCTRTIWSVYLLLAAIFIAFDFKSFSLCRHNDCSRVCTSLCLPVCLSVGLLQFNFPASIFAIVVICWLFISFGALCGDHYINCKQLPDNSFYLNDSSRQQRTAQLNFHCLHFGKRTKFAKSANWKRLLHVHI